MKKKLMITGSFPPDICGVGDYTSCFMSSHDTGLRIGVYITQKSGH